MRWACFVAWVVVATTLGTAQEKASTGDFTKSQTEHIINRIEVPFVVRSVRGTVIRKEGFREPLADVLVEIQGPGDDKKMRKATTNRHGQFKIGAVPVGTYQFKATLNGFQSIMGTIVVSNTARKGDEIKLEMPVGV